jgi:predicted molibdopterin-dependent oxidoreductase YjgC
MGITQQSHGTDNVLALANLAMLTGNLGKPSSGINPLRAQNNNQGACDMGALPDVYTDYQRVDNPDIQKKFEAAWGTQLPSTPGLTIPEILKAAHSGEIKALYLIGVNPVISEPDAARVAEALKKLDFLVVQDIFLSESARLANVVLPAASFAEKDGTFTNTERRVQRVRKAIEPVGNSRPDCMILSTIAKRMGAKGFDFNHPSDIMQEIASLTPSYQGITYNLLDKVTPQWPYNNDTEKDTPILYKDSFPRGKGRFTPLAYRPPAEMPDKDYPFMLTIGSSLYHHQTGTMTHRVSGLNFLNPGGVAEINPADAKKLKIKDGTPVTVVSRRGQVSARARVTNACPPGLVYMDFHFAEGAAYTLTNPALDPVSKIPEYKICAIRIEKGHGG